MRGYRDIGDAVFAHPIEVKVYNNFDRAMKAFRALVQKERILSLYKEKSRYEKPSDKKRRKRKEMKRKIMELEMRSNSELTANVKSSKKREESSHE